MSPKNPKINFFMTKRMPKLNFEHWAVTFVIISFCGATFWISTTFDRMPPILKRGIQPADFPQLILILMLVLTVAMIWLDPIIVDKRLDSKTVGSLVLFGVFGGLTFIDLFLALGAVAALLAMFWGERRWHVVVGIGLMMPALIFLLFDQVFEIRFPRGVLTNLWYG